MKRLAGILAIIMIISCGSGLWRGEVFAASPPPVIEAAAGAVIEIRTGEVLYNKDMNLQLEPASTTKIMTCILALENLEPDTVVEIDRETALTGGSKINLVEGEQITVQELLYGLMLPSANDAAVALAKTVAGTVEDFAAMMNAKARELGAVNTNFVNPNGLHAEGHVSTCYDLALIAQYAMQNPSFRKLVTTYTHTIPATNKTPERELTNTNRLLHDYETSVYVNGVLRYCRYDGCTGIKTGYTPQAGACLVSGARLYDTEVISVVMNTSDLGRFADSIALLDFALGNYHTTKVVSEGTDMGSVTVKHGAVREVNTLTVGERYVLLPSEASTSVVTTKVVWNEDITAPIEKGQVLGVVEIYEGGVLDSTVDIAAAEYVSEGGILSYIGIEDATARIIYIVGGSILGIAAVFFIWLAIMINRKKRRIKKLREQRAMEIAREREERRRDQELRNWFFN